MTPEAGQWNTYTWDPMGVVPLRQSELGETLGSLGLPPRQVVIADYKSLICRATVNKLSEMELTTNLQAAKTDIPWESTCSATSSQGREQPTKKTTRTSMKSQYAIRRSLA